MFSKKKPNLQVSLNIYLAVRKRDGITETWYSKTSENKSQLLPMILKIMAIIAMNLESREGKVQHLHTETQARPKSNPTVSPFQD